MATNYLSASLLSKNYQNMLDADDRENEKQIQFAFESARVSGSQIDADNLLRDDENLLLSFSDLENNSTEEYWQLKRIENTNNPFWKKLHYILSSDITKKLQLIQKVFLKMVKKKVLMYLKIHN